MTAIQLIAMAGGLLEFADKDNIVVMRAEKRPDGQPWSFRLNYSEVMRRVNPKQNIDLKPGDTVLVP
jgi:protein involved in polysaccharide export with SLBB domain